MTNEQLKEYLKTVYDLEKELYLMENLKNSIRDKIATLGLSNRHNIPQPYLDTYLWDRGLMYFKTAAGAITGAALGLLFMHVMPEIDRHIIPYRDPGYYFIGAIVGIVLGAIIGYVRHWTLNKKEKQIEYDKEMVLYKEKLKDDFKRVQAENTLIELLNNEIKEIDSNIEKTSALLKRMYDKDIIFPKYRGFVMVSSLYEHISSGLCSKLEGFEGAYNFLEQEIRTNRIIYKFDQVITQLEAIKENQYMIYSAIQESNNRIDQILESNSILQSQLSTMIAQGDELNSRIGNLQATSALNLYFNELNNKELAYRRQWGI